MAYCIFPKSHKNRLPWPSAAFQLRYHTIDLHQLAQHAAPVKPFFFYQKSFDYLVKLPPPQQNPDCESEYMRIPRIILRIATPCTDVVTRDVEAAIFESLPLPLLDNVICT